MYHPPMFASIVTIVILIIFHACCLCPFLLSLYSVQMAVMKVAAVKMALSSDRPCDIIMMRIVDIIYSLPDMLIIILLSVVLDQVLQSAGGGLVDRLGSNMISIFLVFGLLYWVGMARLVRGQILSIKKNEYVLAAKAVGAKAPRIIRKHILPNSISVIIISTALQIPSAIFTESFLSFVGLGVQAPMPSLGSLANAAREGLQSYPYKLLFPATIICLIVLSLNLLGDGMRDAFDPKLRK